MPSIPCHAIINAVIIHEQLRTFPRSGAGVQAGFEETLTIFDLLCHQGQHKAVSYRFAPVNSLKGAAKGAGVEKDFYRSIADAIDNEPKAFANACLALGGTSVPMGDLGFRFHMFRDLDVILKFYHADEDFPASVTLLWDENLLDFMFYETVFYAVGFLLKTVKEKMGENARPYKHNGKKQKTSPKIGEVFLVAFSRTQPAGSQRRWRSR